MYVETGHVRGRLCLTWRCCGHRWELLWSRAYPDRADFKPVCPTCGQIGLNFKEIREGTDMSSSTAIVKGSISDLAQRSNTSIAEAFMQADVVVIMDVSGSMDNRDSRGCRTRYDVANEEMAKIQALNPGKIAVVAFSDGVVFVPGGQPPLLGGGTDLTRALQFVKVADGAVDFILISDGQPDDEVTALAEARTFRSRIDVVYVGPEGDLYGGRQFLQRLAAARGGKFVVADRAQELAANVQQLLLTGGRGR